MMNLENACPRGRILIKSSKASGPLDMLPLGLSKWKDLNLTDSGIWSRSPFSSALLSDMNSIFRFTSRISIMHLNLRQGVQFAS